MAAIETTRTTAHSTGFTRRLVAAFTTAFATFAVWNDARATRKELNKLSDHELNDIGLCRGDIAKFTG